MTWSTRPDHRRGFRDYVCQRGDAYAGMNRFLQSTVRGSGKLLQNGSQHARQAVSV
jgi:hypothetical protein